MQLLRLLLLLPFLVICKFGIAIRTNIKNKYYNFHNKTYDAVWFLDDEKKLTVSEKISKKVKAKFEDPAFREKMEIAYSKRNKIVSQETREKKSEGVAAQS